MDNLKRKTIKIVIGMLIITLAFLMFYIIKDYSDRGKVEFTPNKFVEALFIFDEKHSMYAGLDEVITKWVSTETEYRENRDEILVELFFRFRFTNPNLVITGSGDDYVIYKFNNPNLDPLDTFRMDFVIENGKVISFEETQIN